MLEHCKFFFPEKKTIANKQEERITLGKIQFQCHYTIQLSVSLSLVSLSASLCFCVTHTRGRLTERLVQPGNCPFRGVSLRITTNKFHLCLFQALPFNSRSGLHLNSQFPSCAEPPFQNEGKYKVFVMTIFFLSHSNKTHLHLKRFPLSLILKARDFRTRKWPIDSHLTSLYAISLCSAIYCPSWRTLSSDCSFEKAIFTSL